METREATSVAEMTAPESAADSSTATIEPGDLVAVGGSIARLRLSLAVERWPGDGATLYGAAQGVFLALLRAGDPAVAATLHDARERKRFALGPLRVSPVAGTSGSLARADLDVALWDQRLVTTAQQGATAALTEVLEVVGHPAHILDCALQEQTTFSALLNPPHAAVRPGQTLVWARFTTPTVFSWGRGLDGRHRYGLLPTPEHVVGSWLRAWNAGGGPGTPLHDDDEWLRERIRIHAIRTLRTVQAHTGKTPITGFTGEVAYEWCGAAPGGRRALRALSGFARFCGTGAKTAYGLGRTETWTA